MRLANSALFLLHGDALRVDLTIDCILNTVENMAVESMEVDTPLPLP